MEGESEPTDAEILAAIEQEIFELINVERVNAGVSALFLDNAIRVVSRAHSEDMAANNYLNHINAAGDGPGERLMDAHLIFTYFGENIAYMYGFGYPAAAVVKGWMNSPSHRDNILFPYYTHTGVGVARDSKGALYFTNDFVCF